jgi:hypothetical protein
MRKEVESMRCPNCGQEESEKFCSNCGTPLDQSAATIEQAPPNGSNQTMDRFKSTSQGYGQFLVKHLKHPSAGKNATDKDFVSGIINISIFALISAIFIYISISAVSLFMGPSFVEAFIKPLFGFLVLLFGVAALTFGALTFLKEKVSFQSIIAKFGGYLTPFIAVYLLAVLFGILKLGSLAFVAGTIALLGTVFVIPTLILFEKGSETNKGLDRLYVAFIVYAISLLVLGFVGNIFVSAMFSGVLGGII